MFTIWCHGNLALNLQLVLIVSRAPCFGVELLKVAELPILESLCCPPPSSTVHSGVHFGAHSVARAVAHFGEHSLVHTLVQTLWCTL